jgi:hypothetical protein
LSLAFCCRFIVFAIIGEFVVVVRRSTVLVPHWSHGLKGIGQKGNGNRRGLGGPDRDLWVPLGSYIYQQEEVIE